MANKIPRVVVDTNVLISAYLFGGKPREILIYIIQAKIIAITSPVILSELSDILRKKFNVKPRDIQLLEEEIKEIFEVVYPSHILKVVRDGAGNRILEAAFDGKTEYIISGDKDLLTIKKYKNISILSASQFINLMSKES